MWKLQRAGSQEAIGRFTARSGILRGRKHESGQVPREGRPGADGRRATDAGHTTCWRCTPRAGGPAVPPSSARPRLLRPAPFPFPRAARRWPAGAQGRRRGRRVQSHRAPAGRGTGCPETEDLRPHGEQPSSRAVPSTGAQAHPREVPEEQRAQLQREEIHRHGREDAPLIWPPRVRTAARGRGEHAEVAGAGRGGCRASAWEPSERGFPRQGPGGRLGFGWGNRGEQGTRVRGLRGRAGLPA